MVYKFSDFPDYPTPTVHDCCHPHFNDLKSYGVPMDKDLDQYLRSELLQFYVFDYKEEQMDNYAGKARVALLPLAQDQEISGEGSLSLSGEVYFSQPEIAPTFSFLTLQKKYFTVWFRADLVIDESVSCLSCRCV